MKWIRKLYYRYRIKRRLREVKTGKRRTSPLGEPVTIDDLVGNEKQFRLSY